MKKLLIVLLAVLLCSCSGSNEESKKPEPVEVKETQSEIPADFKGQAIDGNFKEFSSGQYPTDTYLYLEGKIHNVDILTSNNLNAYGGVFVDNESNFWFLLMDLEMYAKKDIYDNLINHPSAIVARYIGSDDEGNVTLGLIKLFDKETKETTISEVFSKQDYLTIIGEYSSQPEETETVDDNTIRPEVKQAIDAFEIFIDEYCAFMKKYAANPTDLTILVDYAKFMSKYAEMTEEMDALEEDLTLAETNYYVQVMTRCNQKLLEIE